MMTIHYTTSFAPLGRTEHLTAEALRIISQHADYRTRVDHLSSLLKNQPEEAARTALLVALASAEPRMDWSPGR